MRILVTGASGQLGSDVLAELEKRGHTAIGVGSHELDITDRDATLSVIENISPDAIIHCAAWTNVDGAETEPERCREVNSLGTENVAAAAAAVGAKLLYISTDYVFGGEGLSPWEPDCKEFRPLGVYGQTKLAGEAAVEKTEKFFIVRTSWVFGKNGKNFVKTMIRLGESHPQIRVVEDQIGSPTYTVDLARLLVDLVESDKYGFYHATNEGFVSWADFSREIFRMLDMPVEIIGCTTEEYNAKALRPKNSRMSKDKIEQFGRLPEWRDALKRFLRELGYEI